MGEYILSCESTVDLPLRYIKDRKIEVIKYSYLLDGEAYQDDMCEDEKCLPDFYNKLKSGKMASTTQINQQSYYDYFMSLLEKSNEVLHIAFSSGLSSSILNAIKVAEDINSSVQGKRIVVVDSLAASSGYGLLIDMIADLKDEGKSIDELKEWTEKNRLKVHHYVCASDLFHLKRGGRISAGQAFIGDLLNVHPLIYVNRSGQLKVFSKVRGRKKSFNKKLALMEEYAENGLNYSGKCFISHSNSFEEAKMFRNIIEDKFKNLKGKVQIHSIGAVIGAHTGQGTVTVFFYGEERPNLSSD